MAFPILPVGLGLGAIALYLATRSKDESSSSKPGSPGSGPVGPSGPNVMPAALQTVLAQLLSNPNVNPDDLDRMAAELEKYGFVAEAAQLRARAAMLRTRPAPEPAPPAPRPEPPPAPIPPAPIPVPPVPIPVPPVPVPVPPVPVPVPPAPIPVPPAPAPNFPIKGRATAPSGVYVRLGPHESNPIVSRELTYGTPVDILGYERTPTPASPEGWTKVRTPGGVVGYSASKWIEPLASLSSGYGSDSGLVFGAIEIVGTP